jgi:hypothetical protein
MISDRRAQLPPEPSHTAEDSVAAVRPEFDSFQLSDRAALQPPHRKTLEKLMSEIQDVIDRDQEFLIRGEELLARWRMIAHRMQERFREVLGYRSGSPSDLD